MRRFPAPAVAHPPTKLRDERFDSQSDWLAYIHLTTALDRNNTDRISESVALHRKAVARTDEFIAQVRAHLEQASCAERYGAGRLRTTKNTGAHMYFAVIREQGAAWDPSLSMREQDYWPEHADFVNGLLDAGFTLLGGPLGEGNPYRAMVIVDASSPSDAEARLDEDPWTTANILLTKTVDRWEVLAGELASPA